MKWRLAFVTDPAGLVKRRGDVRRLTTSPFADDLDAELSALTVGERLRHVWPFGSRPDLTRQLLLKRLRRDPDGEPYFELGGTRVYFPVSPTARGGRDAALRSAIDSMMLILREACVAEHEMFCDEVRIRPGDVVLDLGGFVGTSAMLFSRLAGPAGLVYTFEPAFPEVLRRNMSANGITNVRVVPMGVADAPGAVEFAVTEEGVDSRFAASGFGGSHVQVDVTSLDAFVEREGVPRVDFIKCDIEGAEELAIRGARDVIERWRPRWTIASYHTDYAGEKQHPKLVRQLESFGYRVREARGGPPGTEHIFAW